MGLLSLFVSGAKKVVDCAPGRQLGRHGEVITDLGMMGDAKLCLRCGAEGYDDSGLMFRFRESQRRVKAPDDWPAIEAARNLPGGINER